MDHLHGSLSNNTNITIQPSINSFNININRRRLVSNSSINQPINFYRNTSTNEVSNPFDPLQNSQISQTTTTPTLDTRHGKNTETQEIDWTASKNRFFSKSKTRIKRINTCINTMVSQIIQSQSLQDIDTNQFQHLQFEEQQFDKMFENMKIRFLENEKNVNLKLNMNENEKNRNDQFQKYLNGRHMSELAKYFSNLDNILSKISLELTKSRTSTLQSELFKIKIFRAILSCTYAHDGRRLDAIPSGVFKYKAFGFRFALKKVFDKYPHLQKDKTMKTKAGWTTVLCPLYLKYLETEIEKEKIQNAPKMPIDENTNNVNNYNNNVASVPNFNGLSARNNQLFVNPLSLWSQNSNNSISQSIHSINANSSPMCHNSNNINQNKRNKRNIYGNNSNQPIYSTHQHINPIHINQKHTNSSRLSHIAISSSINDGNDNINPNKRNQKLETPISGFSSNNNGNDKLTFKNTQNNNNNIQSNLNSSITELPLPTSHNTNYLHNLSATNIDGSSSLNYSKPMLSSNARFIKLVTNKINNNNTNSLHHNNNINDNTNIRKSSTVSSSCSFSKPVFTHLVEPFAYVPPVNVDHSNNNNDNSLNDNNDKNIGRNPGNLSKDNNNNHNRSFNFIGNDPKSSLLLSKFEAIDKALAIKHKSIVAFNDLKETVDIICDDSLTINDLTEIISIEPNYFKLAQTNNKLTLYVIEDELMPNGLSKSKRIERSNNFKHKMIKFNDIYNSNPLTTSKCTNNTNNDNNDNITENIQWTTESKLDSINGFNSWNCINDINDINDKHNFNDLNRFNELNNFNNSNNCRNTLSSKKRSYVNQTSKDSDHVQPFLDTIDKFCNDKEYIRQLLSHQTEITEKIDKFLTQYPCLTNCFKQKNPFSDIDFVSEF